MKRLFVTRNFGSCELYSGIEHRAPRNAQVEAPGHEGQSKHRPGVAPPVIKERMRVRALALKYVVLINESSTETANAVPHANG